MWGASACAMTCRTTRVMQWMRRPCRREPRYERNQSHIAAGGGPLSDCDCCSRSLSSPLTLTLPSLYYTQRTALVTQKDGSIKLGFKTFATSADAVTYFGNLLRNAKVNRDLNEVGAVQWGVRS